MRFAVLLGIALAAPRATSAQIERLDSAACARAADALSVGGMTEAAQHWSLPVASMCGDTTSGAAALDRRRGLPYSIDLHVFFDSVSLDASAQRWLIVAARSGATSEAVGVLSLITLMQAPYAVSAILLLHSRRYWRPMLCDLSTRPRSVTRHRLLFAVGLLLGAAPRVLPAQLDARCAAHAATLRTGSFARPDSQSRAYAEIQGCPVSIRAEGIRAALARRNSLYSFAHPQTAAFAYATRDSAVVEALRRMTADRSALPTSRVLAITTLLSMVSRHPGLDLNYFVRHREGEACIAGGSPIAPARVGGPLTADSVRRFVETLIPLERSRSTDPAVRSAANCALNVIRLSELGGYSQIGPLRAGDIRLTHRCGSVFVATSRAPYSVVAAVYLAGATRPSAVTVSGTQGKSASRETWLDAGRAANVRLVIDDLTYTADRTPRTCAQ